MDLDTYLKTSGVSGAAFADRIGVSAASVTVAGYPDLTVYASGGRVGHLELKSCTGRLSDSQIEVQQKLTGLGHRYAIVKHTDDVEAALREWGWM